MYNHTDYIGVFTSHQKYCLFFHLILKRPHTPLEKALEFHYFDFEFADEPSDTSLKQNVDVFQVDESRPDM